MVFEGRLRFGPCRAFALLVFLVACGDGRPPPAPDPSRLPESRVPPVGPGLFPREVDPRVISLRPTPREEPWRQIPWHTDLLSAREVAERTGKPVFLWLMDGHPLGGT